MLPAVVVVGGGAAALLMVVMMRLIFGLSAADRLLSGVSVEKSIFSA